MDVDRLVTEYLAALGDGDAEGVLALFTEAGVVESPLYGTKPACEFYPALFADTADSTLTLKGTMSGQREGRPLVSFWFDFDWVLSDGTLAPFSVVDVAELDDEGRIERLHIVYDTAVLRESFNRLRPAGP